MATREQYLGNVIFSDPTAERAIGLVSKHERRSQFPKSLNGDPFKVGSETPLTQAEIDERIHRQKTMRAQGSNHAQYRAEVYALRSARRQIQGGNK